MKLNDNFEMDRLEKEYGFTKGPFISNICISVDRHRRVAVGAQLHWMASESYYSNDFDLLVDLIKDGVFVKGVE